MDDFHQWVQQLIASGRASDEKWELHPDADPVEYRITVARGSCGDRLQVQHAVGRECPPAVDVPFDAAVFARMDGEFDEHGLALAARSERVAPLLGNTLFPNEEFRDMFFQAWGGTRRDRHEPSFLRLRLVVYPELDSLDWEAFSIPGPGGHPFRPALLPGVAVVRGSVEPDASCRVHGMLRALVVGSKGGGELPPLPDAHPVAIKCSTALNRLASHAFAHPLMAVESPDPPDLLCKLEEAHDVVFLYGHFKSAPPLYVAAQGDPVQLGDMVKCMGKQVPRAMVLMGCGSAAMAPHFIRAGVPAVVAMAHPISQSAAGTALETIAEALCRASDRDPPEPLDVALARARQAVHRAVDPTRFGGASAEWISPRLYLAAADARLLDRVEAHLAEAYVQVRRELSTGRSKDTEGGVRSPEQGDWTCFIQPRLRQRGASAGDDHLCQESIPRLLAGTAGDGPPRHAVVAPAGSGKTTLADALEAGHIQLGPRGKLPSMAVSLPLGRGDSGDTVASCFQKNNNLPLSLQDQALKKVLDALELSASARQVADDALRRYMTSGACVIVLDGLDEAGRTLDGRGELRGFAEKLLRDLTGFPGPVLLTTRGSALHALSAGTDASGKPAAGATWRSVFEIEPLTSEETRRLLDHYGVDSSSEVATQLTDRSRSLLEPTPLVVHLLGALAEPTESGAAVSLVEELERGRFHLYDRVLPRMFEQRKDALLRTIDQIRNVSDDQKLTAAVERARAVAGGIARALYDRDQWENFRESDVRQVLRTVLLSNRMKVKDLDRWCRWFLHDSNLLRWGEPEQRSKPAGDRVEKVGDGAPGAEPGQGSRPEAPRHKTTAALQWTHNTFGEFLAACDVAAELESRHNEDEKERAAHKKAYVDQPATLRWNNLLLPSVATRIDLAGWRNVWPFLASAPYSERLERDLDWLPDPLLQVLLYLYEKSDPPRHGLLEIILHCLAERPNPDTGQPLVPEDSKRTKSREKLWLSRRFHVGPGQADPGASDASRGSGDDAREPARFGIPWLLRQKKSIEELRLPRLAELEPELRKWLVEKVRQDNDPRVHDEVRRLVMDLPGELVTRHEVGNLPNRVGKSDILPDLDVDPDTYRGEHTIRVKLPDSPETRVSRR